MRTNFSYWFTDFCVGLLTFNFLLIKKIIRENTGGGEGIRGKTVLDIGCGTGLFAPLFSKSKYVGIDIDRGAISYALSRHPGYQFKVTDASNFNLKNKFDFILIVGVLHHMDINMAARCLGKAAVHLKPKGKILIIEAIPPLISLNLPGYLLRRSDRGKHIRKLSGYIRMAEKSFEINKVKNIYGGFFDYAYILASLPNSKK